MQRGKNASSPKTPPDTLTPEQTPPEVPTVANGPKPDEKFFTLRKVKLHTITRYTYLMKHLTKLNNLSYPYSTAVEIDFPRRSSRENKGQPPIQLSPPKSTEMENKRRKGYNKTTEHIKRWHAAEKRAQIEKTTDGKVLKQIKLARDPK